MLVNMRPTTKVLAAGALLGAAAVVILSVRPSLATSFGGGGALDVTVLGDVKVAQPVDTNSNITNTYVPVGMGPEGTPKLSAEVTGLAGGEVVTTVSSGTVSISGPVTFDSQTLSLLAGERNCTYYPVGHAEVDGGVWEAPAVVGQTGIQLVIHDLGMNVDYVSCFPAEADAGPLPNCTRGPSGVAIPVHNHGTLELDIGTSQRVRCRACTHSGPPSGNFALVGGSVSVCTPP